MAPGGTACGVSDGWVSDVWVNDGQIRDDKLVQERLGDELRERAHKCGTVVAPGEEPPSCDSALRLTCALIVCSNLSRVFFGWLR